MTPCSLCGICTGGLGSLPSLLGDRPWTVVSQPAGMLSNCSTSKPQLSGSFWWPLPSFPFSLSRVWIEPQRMLRC
jgi:hypothetical protein